MTQSKNIFPVVVRFFRISGVLERTEVGEVRVPSYFERSTIHPIMVHGFTHRIKDLKLHFWG